MRPLSICGWYWDASSSSPRLFQNDYGPPLWFETFFLYCLRTIVNAYFEISSCLLSPVSFLREFDYVSHFNNVQWVSTRRSTNFYRISTKLLHTTRSKRNPQGACRRAHNSPFSLLTTKYYILFSFPFTEMSIISLASFSPQVPNGDVANLPSNYIINHLLDLRRTHSKPFCNKHEDEILKLFCLNCQQLICQDCALIDHRDHKCNFAKDVFPAEKEKIVNAMLESKEKVLALQGSMGAFEEQKKSLDQNAREVDQKIDGFFNEVIQFLKGEKQRMKDELKRAVKTQKEEIHAELSYFEASLEYASSRLEVIEHLLAKVSDEDALLAKNDMLKQLSDINSVLPHLQPTPQTIYDFGADGMLDVINKMEAISLH